MHPRRPIAAAVVLSVALAAGTATGQEERPGANEVVWTAAKPEREEGWRVGVDAPLRFELPGDVDLTSATDVVLTLSDVAAGTDLVVRLSSGRRPAARRFRVQEASAGTIRLPLRYFGQATHVVARWSQVRTLALESSGPVRVREVRIERAEGESAELSEAELDRHAGEGAWRDVAGFRVWTQTGAAGADDLAAELSALGKALEADVGAVLPDNDAGAPRLLLFRDAQSYAAFWERLAPRLGAEGFQAPLSGFATAGIATTWLPKGGEELPVRALHEAAHAWIESHLGLANRGCWLQEGLAERHTWPRRRGLGPIATMRAGFADEAQREPLASLTDGRPLRAAEYWQARTLVDWFLDDAERRGAFHELIRRVLIGGTSSLSETLVQPEPLSRVPRSVEALERAWIDWGRDRFDAE